MITDKIHTIYTSDTPDEIQRVRDNLDEYRHKLIYEKLIHLYHENKITVDDLTELDYILWTYEYTLDKIIFNKREEEKKQ